MSNDGATLLLGCGNSRAKKIYCGTDSQWHGKLVTVDMDPNCGADYVLDLEHRPLPFPDESFDEIHTYDSLEHWGRQGDWRGWFDEMGEYHRLLKPGGRFFAGVPIGADHFADPGHVRFITVNYFMFLHQDWYDKQHASGTAATDYRWYWKKNFIPRHAATIGEPPHHLTVILEKA